MPAIRVCQLRASTVESYRRNLAVHVPPRLGHRPLSLITTAELDRLSADLLAGGHRRALAPRSVRYIGTVLLGLYNHAVRKRHVAANRAPYGRPPAPQERLRRRCAAGFASS